MSWLERRWLSQEGQPGAYPSDMDARQLMAVLLMQQALGQGANQQQGPAGPTVDPLVQKSIDAVNAQRPQQGPPMPERPYENQSILPDWMDRYVPSVKGIATTGNPFATEQQMREAIRRKGLPY
jgi:hypothetical protein